MTHKFCKYCNMLVVSASFAEKNNKCRGCVDKARLRSNLTDGTRDESHYKAPTKISPALIEKRRLRAIIEDALAIEEMYHL